MMRIRVVLLQLLRISMETGMRFGLFGFNSALKNKKFTYKFFFSCELPESGSILIQ